MSKLQFKDQINFSNKFSISTEEGISLTIRGGHHEGYYNVEFDYEGDNHKMEINWNSEEGYFINWSRVNNSFNYDKSDDIFESVAELVTGRLWYMDKYSEAYPIEYDFDYNEYDPTRPEYIPEYVTFTSMDVEMAPWGTKEFISEEDNEKYHGGEVDLNGCITRCVKLDQGGHWLDEHTLLAITAGQRRKLIKNKGHYKAEVRLLNVYNAGELYDIIKFEKTKKDV